MTHCPDQQARTGDPGRTLPPGRPPGRPGGPVPAHPAKPGGPAARWGAALFTLAGLILAGWLLAHHGAADILGLLRAAGWGVPLVVCFHVLQLLASSEAWRAMAAPPRRASRGASRGAARGALGPAAFLLLRWVREGVNALLPVAQIGGEVVGARLLHRRGAPLPLAVAGTVGDVMVGVLTQVMFTLLGLVLLVAARGMSGTAGLVLAGTGITALAVAGVAAGLWFGLAGWAGRWGGRLAARLGLAAGNGDADGATGAGRLDDALRHLLRDRRGLARCVALHVLSWMLGGAEVCLALHVLGAQVDFAEGLAIEALGQAIKTAGFLVPGSLGVAEGGYVVVCGLFGLAPGLAIALALVKRLRDLAFGLPALAAWQVLELRRAPARKAPTPA